MRMNGVSDRKKNYICNLLLSIARFQQGDLVIL